jgi:hypothetical protein
MIKPYLYAMSSTEIFRQKGYDPKFLIKECEKYFTVIGEKYSVTFGESLQQRRNTKNYFSKYKAFEKAMDVKKIVNRTLKDVKKINKALEKGKPIPKLSVSGKDIQELEDKSSFISGFDWDMAGFEKVNKEYLQLQFKHHIAGGALDGLLSSGFLEVITGAVTFILTFLVSLWIEEPMAKLLKPVGDTLSKLLPALIVYLIFDRIIDWIKNKLLWKRLAVCKLRVEKIRQEIERANAE